MHLPSELSCCLYWLVTWKWFLLFCFLSSSECRATPWNHLNKKRIWVWLQSPAFPPATRSPSRLIESLRGQKGERRQADKPLYFPVSLRFAYFDYSSRVLVAGHNERFRVHLTLQSRYFTFLKAKSSCFIFSLCGSVLCRRNLNFIIFKRIRRIQLQSGRRWRWDKNPGVLGGGKAEAGDAMLANGQAQQTKRGATAVAAAETATSLFSPPLPLVLLWSRWGLTTTPSSSRFSRTPFC